MRIIGDDPEKKCHLLLDYADRPGEEVDDPWFSGDFRTTWNDVYAGCSGILEQYQNGELL